MWRNDRGGKWTTRIIWYQGEDPNDIRLELLDQTMEKQLFPRTREEADHIWSMFKQGSPSSSGFANFITDLMELLGRKYPHLNQQGYPGPAEADRAAGVDGAGAGPGYFEKRDL